MGNTSEFYKDNISKQRTFQPNHENINLSKMFRHSTELKPSFKVDSNILPLLTSFPSIKKLPVHQFQTALSSHTE